MCSCTDCGNAMEVEYEKDYKEEYDSVSEEEDEQKYELVMTSFFGYFMSFLL